MAITLDGSNVNTTGLINSKTAVASTSGTSIDFTGIPSTAKRVTIMFSGVSTNGTSDVNIQLGTSGGIVTSGYLGVGTNNTTVSNHTNGFRDGNQNALCVRHGIYTLCHMGSNIWSCAGNIGRSDAATFTFIAGSVPLSGTLTTVRITTVGGTDAFDAGTINVLYE